MVEYEQQRPVLVPASVWDLPEIRRAARNHDFAEVVRLLRLHVVGLRQTDLAEALGVSPTLLSKIQNGARELASFQHVARLVDSLGMPPTLLFSPESAHSDDPAVSRRDVEDAAAESMDALAAISRTNASPELLEALSADLRRLSTAYVHAPPRGVFRDLRNLRHRLLGLLEGRQPPCTTRELLVLCGSTCVLLGHASQNLGFPQAAMTHVRTAVACARQADHDRLRSWALGTAALIVEWSPRQHEALRVIDQALAYAPPGEARIRLHAIEARTSARLGDHTRARGALGRLSHDQEETPPLDDMADFGGMFTFPRAKQDYYRGSVHALLGDADLAETYATRALVQYETGPADEYSYGDAVLARLDTVQAHLARRDLGAASDALLPILELPQSRRIRQMETPLRLVREAVQHSSIRTDPRARDIDVAARNYAVLDAGSPPRRQLP